MAISEKGGPEYRHQHIIIPINYGDPPKKVSQVLRNSHVKVFKGFQAQAWRSAVMLWFLGPLFSLACGRLKES